MVPYLTFLGQELAIGIPQTHLNLPLLLEKAALDLPNPVALFRCRLCTGLSLGDFTRSFAADNRQPSMGFVMPVLEFRFGNPDGKAHEAGLPQGALIFRPLLRGHGRHNFGLLGRTLGRGGNFIAGRLRFRHGKREFESRASRTVTGSMGLAATDAAFVAV